jgi:hypothetical protein
MRNVTVRLGLLKKYNRCIYLSYICSISILYIISYIHIQCTHRDAINGLENMETWPSWLVDPYMFQSLFKVQSRCIAQVKYHVYIYIFMYHIHLYEYRYHICIYASYRICGTIYLSIYLCIYIYTPGQVNIEPTGTKVCVPSRCSSKKTLPKLNKHGTTGTICQILC